jgi:hypothetical protein
VDADRFGCRCSSLPGHADTDTLGVHLLGIVATNAWQVFRK